MKCKNEKTGEVQADLKTIFAAELFSKLSKENQDVIIEQIKALLSRE